MFPDFFSLYPYHLFCPTHNKTKHTELTPNADHLRFINIGTCQDVTKTILHLPLCENILRAHLVHYISPWSTCVLPVKENHLGEPSVLRDLIVSTWEHIYLIYIRTNYDPTTCYTRTFYILLVNLKGLHLNNLRP